MAEWDAYYAEGAILSPEFPIYINLVCQNCKKEIGSVWIEAKVLKIPKKVLKKLTKDIEKYEKSHEAS